MDYKIAFKFFAALFAVTNPFTHLPIFTSLNTDKKANKIRNKTTIAIIAIMLISLFTGNKILRILGITTGAFETAGGIIIFLIALSMTQGNISLIDSASNKEKDKNKSSIVPLSISIVSGPGAIATIIIYNNYITGTQGLVAAAIIISICVLLIWIAFFYANKIRTLMSSTGAVFISRIMGIILASIAVEMVANGLKDILPL